MALRRKILLGVVLFVHSWPRWIPRDGLARHRVLLSAVWVVGLNHPAGIT